jgi:hypothetical protein
MIISHVGLLLMGKILEWSKECICNSEKTCFDAIEFGTNSSRIELLCGKCNGLICWWPISTEQVFPMAARGTKKSSAVPVEMG